MPHSDPLEQHAKEKLQKITDFLKDENATPLNVELHIEGHKTHAYNKAQLHLRTPNYSLDSHDECEDLYIAIDNTIDKMVKLLKKEKDKQKDKNHKRENEKNKFASDKYKL